MCMYFPNICMFQGFNHPWIGNAQKKKKRTATLFEKAIKLLFVIFPKPYLLAYTLPLHILSNLEKTEVYRRICVACFHANMLPFYIRNWGIGKFWFVLGVLQPAPKLIEKSTFPKTA